MGVGHCDSFGWTQRDWHHEKSGSWMEVDTRILLMEEAVCMERTWSGHGFFSLSFRTLAYLWDSTLLLDSW